MQVFKQTGRKPRQLAELPELPEEFGYLWDWWKVEVFNGEPLTWPTLHAWAEVTKKDLRGWEASVIMGLDNIFWQVKRE